MKKFAIAALLGLGLLAHAPAAKALTYHWSYTSPSTCSVSNGVPGSGGVVGLNSNGFAACQLRLPQGATMTGARVYVTGASTTFTIQSTSYASPASATTLAQWTGGTSSGGWVTAPGFSGGIDNENVSYFFNVSVGQTSMFGSFYSLIEVTYTLP